jgi:precorrin-3B methylase
MNEADGVILIYNPDAPGQDQQLGHWFDFFVKNNGLSDEQCLIFAHRVNPSNERFRPRKSLTFLSFSSL